MNAYDQTHSRSSSLGAHKYSIESDEDVNVCWDTLLFMCMHVCVCLPVSLKTLSSGTITEQRLLSTKEPSLRAFLSELL